MGIGLETLNNDAELFDFVVKQGNGVKGLADMGLATVPQKYVHPPHERIDRSEVIDSSPYVGAPIDLSELLNGSNKGAAVDAICGAAERLGFFQVLNHGVPVEVMERAKQAAHTFFNLPCERKAAFFKTRTPCPRVFYGTSFSPESEKSLEWKDYLSMHYYSDREALQFWPQECREAALDYMNAANKTIHAIFSALLRNLGVEIEESKINEYIRARAVNMNYYPKCPSPELTVGVGRHSDLTPLTILLQDDIGGLFVKVEDKGWIEIPPLQGALVVNVGDTLEILSNGRYKSAEHRVLASGTKPRVTIPIFVGPRTHTMIGPLPGLPEKDGKTLYRQLLYREYMTNYFQAAHQGKLSLEYAKIAK